MSGIDGNFAIVQIIYLMQQIPTASEELTRAVKDLAGNIYGGDFNFKEDFSLPVTLSASLQLDYSHICQVFFLTTNITLEKYITGLQVEKIKELLVYGNDPMNVIAARLGFRNVRQLSKAFKAHTGLNPGYFKEVRKSRMSIREMPGRPS